MKIKRIKKLKVNTTIFSINWDKDGQGGGFNYSKREIVIGTKDFTENEILMILCHELQEICAVEMGVRLRRPDCETDFIFVYDHRQHESMMYMFAGLLGEFL